MFTGLVQAKAAIGGVQHRGHSSVLVLRAGPLADRVAIGDSVMINGVCLTVTAARGEQVDFDVSAETLRRTTLGTLRRNDPVNVELAMQPTDRFGGHFVSGHVDGVGTIVGMSALPGETRMKVRVSPELASMMMMKGSVAVDGVSLTIAALEGDTFEVSLIPHTLSVTTLGRKRAGEPVNIECDMIGKWVRRFTRPEAGGGSSEGSLTIKRLEEEGY